MPLPVPRLLLPLLLAPAFPGAASAEVAAIGGVGNAACSVYTDLARQDPSRADNVFQSWAQGFISGINFQLLQDRIGSDDDLIDMNPPTYPPPKQLRFLHTYCQLHPDEPVRNAAVALIIELRKAHAGQKTPPTE